MREQLLWVIEEIDGQYRGVPESPEKLQETVQLIRELLPEYDEQEIAQHLFDYLLFSMMLPERQHAIKGTEYYYKYYEEADTFGSKLARAIQEHPDSPLQSIICCKEPTRR